MLVLSLKMLVTSVIIDNKGTSNTNPKSSQPVP